MTSSSAQGFAAKATNPRMQNEKRIRQALERSENRRDKRAARYATDSWRQPIHSTAGTDRRPESGEKKHAARHEPCPPRIRRLPFFGPTFDRTELSFLLATGGLRIAIYTDERRPLEHGRFRRTLGCSQHYADGKRVKV